MLDILFEDNAIIVLNKPSGLLTQAPPGIDSLERRVKNYLIDKEKKTGRCYLGIPHRLDRPSSGAILFGKNSRATHRVSEQLAARQVEKTYRAMLEGSVAEESGTWVDTMRKIPDRPVGEIVPPEHPDAREAVLHFQRIAVNETSIGAISHLAIRLETGRMHQIRLQASSRGMPLLGDTMYGARHLFGEAFDDIRLRAIALHARSLSLLHPMSHEPLTLTAPFPANWKMFPEVLPVREIIG